MFFMKEKRDYYKSQNPNSDFGELSKIMGRAWQDCDKEKYNLMHEQDKLRYQEEMKDWNESRPDTSSTDSSDEPVPAKKRTRKVEGAPKRPVNGYLLFSKSKREDVKKDNPGLDAASVNRVLGNIWKGMTEEEKKPFMDEAELDKIRYRRELEVFKAQQAEKDESSSSQYYSTDSSD
eukprot:TRINITY_DN4610_c0_g1_i1.p1 TRINITY_DN4610_c0_g1~~TRINITY_DN4610_c0_g1_i1.p1  ORF type:complete len:177 (+),score=49.88 TRINITY_DN4610_c0_g1_i1:148-678(+)